MDQRGHREPPKKRRVSMLLGGLMVAFGIFVIAIINADPGSAADDLAAVDIFGGVVGLVGLGLVAISFRLPTAEILRLAKAHNGLLTLSEIVITLDISPSRALKALQALQKVGIASQRWQEIRKNIWEFPDYLDLPIDETLRLANSKNGRLTLDDLVAAGQSSEVARQTLNALSEKGLAHQDPGGPAVIVTAQ